MAPQEGILIDTSPYSASPALTKLRYQREQVIIKAWQATLKDKQGYDKAIERVGRFHYGDRTVKLVDWEKVWLRARYPDRKEYHAFEPAPYFEDVLKKHWATEEKKRVEALDREYPLLLPVQAWTLIDKAEGKGKEKKKEEVEEKGEEKGEEKEEDEKDETAKEEEKKKQEAEPGNAPIPKFASFEEWWNFIVGHRGPEDLISLD